VEEEMYLIELSELLLDDNKAEQYLLEVGILKTFTHCDKCGSDKLGRIRRGKVKCYKCKHEWNQRQGSMLEGINLNTNKILLFIKLVEYNFNDYKIGKELRMNGRTVKKLRKQLKNKGG
jgi:transposase